MTWKILVTKTFSKEFKKYKKDSKIIKALDKKIKRLKENPNNVGGILQEDYQHIFEVKNNKIFLISIDHRKFNYENFF